MMVLYALLAVGALRLFDEKVILGLSFGTVVAYLNFYLITYRIERLDQFQEERKAVHYVLLGTGMRLLLIIVALWFAIRDPRMEFAAVVLGVLTFQIIVFFQMIVAIGQRGLQERQNSVVVKQRGGE